MKLVYVGSHYEVEVTDSGHTARRDGDPIDVPDDVAKRLLDQTNNWKQADAPKPTPNADDKGGS